MEELVAVARIVRTRGIKGEVVAEILTDFQERFELLDSVLVLGPSGETLNLELEKFWFQSGRVILKFVDYDSIETSESLRNFELCVPESDAIDLGEDEYFDWQLKGCQIETINGERIGEVRELMRTGGTELLVVQGKKEYLIPFANAICVDVDIDKKLIRIDPPDGLLEF